MSFKNAFKGLVPKEKKFYHLFVEASENMIQASEILVKLVQSEDHEVRVTYYKQIKELEHKGDQITHKVFEELSNTFITPFDREDIYKLNSCLDDVVDYINGSAQKIKVLNPEGFIPEFLEIAELINDACREIDFSLKELKSLKNANEIREACIRINTIENKADDLYRQAISDLFEKEKNPIELIKKKEILEVLEEATDKAEDVSDILKSILIKVS